MTDTSTSAACLAEALKAAGITRVFGHPGGEVVDLVEALAQCDIEFLLTGHESTAAFMAATMGRLTGLPGACLATLGPGACNLVLGVGCAYLDRDPLLALSARTAAQRERVSQKQNLPLNELFAPISKWSVALDGTATTGNIQAAVSVSLAPPRGPVYLTMPADVATRLEQPGHPLSPPVGATPDAGALAAIAAALQRARRPAAVVGLALSPERDAPAIQQFLDETCLPYAVLPQSKGVVDEGGAMYLGTVAPGAGDAHVVARLMEADCLIGIGFDPVESSQDWHYQRPLYNLANASARFRDYTPTLECTGNVTDLVQRLAASYRGGHAWTAAEAAETRQKVVAAITPPTSASRLGLSPFHLVRAVQQALPPQTTVSLDVGAHKMLMGQAWKAIRPNAFLVSNGLSAMGYGVPAALAAALVRPHQPVVSVLGDGGFAMMVQELETTLRLGVSPLFVVLCDRSLAVIKVAQAFRGLAFRGVDFAPVDWVRVAEGFGVRGETATTLGAVEQVVAAWLAQPEPLVLAVPIDETLYAGLNY